MEKKRAKVYREIAENSRRMGLRHARAHDISSKEWHVCSDGVILCDYKYGYGIYNSEYDEPMEGEDWCEVCTRFANEMLEQDKK